MKLTYHAHLRRIKRIQRVADEIFFSEAAHGAACPSLLRLLNDRADRLEKLARRQFNAGRSQR